MNKRLVLGLSGFPGTGKTKIAKHLKEEHDFTVFEGSEILRARAVALGQVLTDRSSYDTFFREQQRQLGMSWLADMALASEGYRILQCGLRARPDFARIKQFRGVVLGLMCPPEVCVARIDTTNPKNPKTIGEYFMHMALEESTDEYGTHTGWCVASADHHIDTSQPVEAMLDQVDKVIARIEAS